MNLYNEKGEVVGLKEVAQWWIEKYPADIFLGLSDRVEIIVQIRELMKELLKFLKG